MTTPSLFDHDLTEIYEALNKVFSPSDSVPASFCMDIFGLSHENSSAVVKEWRRIEASRNCYGDPMPPAHFRPIEDHPFQ